MVERCDQILDTTLLHIIILLRYAEMSKLTLSVDGAVISRAKLFAKRQGVSISKLVEAYLAAVAEPSTGGTQDAPVLRSVRGVLKNADVKHYKRHLVRKYR